ncbi:MAG: HIT domain-containing protein [Streptococcaceae bacterium]|jgi:histidine triad (HIT) family protein|nr:HIT domain-containing protein [Streptococcaceae bacterium]
MSDCIFCDIIAGKSPAYKVYEDEAVLAFLDHRPVDNGHTLIIPKKHARNLLTMTPEETADLFRRVPAVIERLRVLDFDGMQEFVHNEAIAHQVVFHTHIHLVPRWEKTQKNMTLQEVWEKLQ